MPTKHMETDQCYNGLQSQIKYSLDLVNNYRPLTLNSSVCKLWKKSFLNNNTTLS